MSAPTQGWERPLQRFSRLFLLTPDARGLLRTALLMASVFVLTAWLHPGRADRVLRHVVTLGMTGALLVLQGCGWRQVRGFAEAGRGTLRAGFALLALAALFVPAFGSSDVHAYAQIGRLQAAYDENPYVRVPSDLPGWEADPIFTRTWQDTPCVYGPLFAHVTEIVAFLGGGDPQRTIFLFKLLGAFLVGAVGLLIASARGAQEAGARQRSIFLWLWSPFVLLQFVANAHNDVFLALFLVAGLQAARRGRWAFVLPLLSLAVLVKLVALVLLPAACVLLWKRWNRLGLLVSLAASLALGVLVAQPYARDLDAFAWRSIGDQLAAPSYSLLAALSDAWAALAGWLPPLAGTTGAVTAALQVLFLGGFAVFLLARLRRAWRDAEYDGNAFLEDAVALLFVLIVLASGKFFPWYLGMLLPAALLLPDRHPLRTLTVVLSVTWLLAFTAVGKARILDVLVMTVLPLLLYAHARRRPRRAPDPAV